MTGQLLRELAKGNLPTHGDLEDEGFLDRVWGGLFEVQLFGAAQRVIEPFQYNNMNIDSAFMGMMPQVRAVLDLMGAVIGGYGLHGQFPLDERLEKTAQKHTPAVKGFINWVDRLAWPDQGAFRESQRRSRRWFKEMKEAETGKPMAKGEYQINPVYTGIYDRLYRMDLEGARREAIKYYKIKQADGRTTPDKAIRDLRRSLLARAPIDLSLENAVKFLGTQPLERRRWMADIHIEYLKMVEAVAPAP